MQKTNIVEQLKSRFESPKEAYKFVYLALTLQKSIVVNPNHKFSAFTQELLSKQEKVNELISSLDKKIDISKFSTLYKEIYGLKNGADSTNFVKKLQKAEDSQVVFHFDLNEWIENITTSKFFNIDAACSKIKSWEQISDLVQKYQIDNLPSTKTDLDFKKHATKIVEQFQFSHINVQSFYANKVESIGVSAEELSDITNFDKDQIGQNILGIHLGYEMDKDFSAYCVCDPTQTRFMLFKPHTISSTFGHEWMHFIDYEVGNKLNSKVAASEQTKLSNEFKSKLNNFNSLVASFREDINVEDNLLQEKTQNSMVQVFHRFLGKYIENEENLPQRVKEYFDKKIEKPNTDVESFFKNYLKPGYPHHYIAFIEAEMDLYNDLNQSPAKNNFLEFAQKADQSLISITKENQWEGYTSSHLEMLARSFETFLISKKAKNLTQKMDSHMYPQNMEANLFNKKWEKALEEIRNIFHEKPAFQFKKTAL